MKRAITKKLRVGPIVAPDVYKDMARVSRGDRGAIREGRICRVNANGKTKHLIIRGLSEELTGYITMDAVTRDFLGLRDGGHYDFSIKEVGALGKIIWACTVADPAARVSAWIAIWSLITGVGFGLLGLIIGLWPFWR